MKKLWSVLGASALLVGIVGCGGSSSPFVENGAIRAVNAQSGGLEIDVVFDQTELATMLAPDSAGQYIGFESGIRVGSVGPSGGAGEVDFIANIDEEELSTVYVLEGEGNAFATALVLRDDRPFDLENGAIKVRVVHGVAAAGEVHFFVVPVGQDVALLSPENSIEFGEASEYQVSPNADREVVVVDSTTQLVLARSGSLAARAQQVTTLVLVFDQDFEFMTFTDGLPLGDL